MKFYRGEPEPGVQAVSRSQMEIEHCFSNCGP